METANPYAYAQGNPATLSDPTGANSCAGLGTYCGRRTPKVYTGAYGCTGRTQEAVNACVAAVKAANKPRGNAPTLVNRTNPQVNQMIGGAAFSSALDVLVAYFKEFGAIKNRNFTAILSEVEVQTGSGIEGRTIVFVSQGGLPKILQRIFEKMNVQVVRATPEEGHAEIAAKDFREDIGEQEEALGGRITGVNAAVMNNGACSDACGEAITKYVDDEDVTISKGGLGFVRSATGQVRVFQGSYMRLIRQLLGGGSNLEAIQNLDASEGVDLDGPLDNQEP